MNAFIVSAIRLTQNKWVSAGLLAFFSVAVIVTLSLSYFDFATFTQAQYNEMFLFIAIGFLAQTIDGAIGMAYGLSTTTMLMSMKFSPAMASAVVHVTEMFTTAASGYSHFKVGNVNKKLFRALIIPAVIGVILGAYVLSSVDGKVIKPFVSLYLFIMGIVVITKAVLNNFQKKKKTHLTSLGFFGGFLDAIGGGGWGAVVTTTLMSTGRTPRFAIGTVNFTEFFVTFISAGAFIFFLTFTAKEWLAVACIVLGGLPASFFSAFIVKKLKPRALMIIVGITIMIMSAITLYQALKAYNVL